MLRRRLYINLTTLTLTLIVTLILLTMRGPVLSQSSPIGSALITQTFALSSTGPSPTLALTGGQSVCSVVIEGSTAFTGLTLVPQAASDGPSKPQTWTTVTTINNGSITATGAPAPGSIVGFGLTNFRVNVSAISSGTATGVIACNTANGSGGSSVTIANSPSPADGLGAPLIADGGTSTTSVASAATTVIKATPGRINGMLVTTLGTGIFTCYDNASTGSGKVIAGFIASAPQFSTSTLRPYATNGITCVSAASGPVVTVLSE
jgi:hypothetical protein